MAGAGVAGVAAAIAAARRGCRVVLLEKERDLGGTATHGLLGTICGLYRNGGAEAGATLNGGITGEIMAALAARAPESIPRKVGKVFVFPYDAIDLQQTLAELCAQEPNLTVCSATAVVAALADNGRVQQVVARQEVAEQIFRPRVVVDASGDGELAALAGAEFELSASGERQLAGLTVVLDGVAADDALGIKTPLLVTRGIAAGTLPATLRFTTFSRGLRPAEGRLKINLPETTLITAAEINSLAGQLTAYLARELPAFTSAVITAIPDRIFPREGRRIRGDYLLTAADILACRKFSDGVVKGAWPMELWTPNRGVSYRYPADGDYYEIPLRCLKVAGFSNLFTAGRCISVSREALGSTRVIGCCIPLGEQAGLAAAKLCSEGA